MIKYTELRCGNLHYYHIEDKYDERKAWDQLSIIDPTDLQHLKEYPDDADYKPIVLSEEWLQKASFTPNEPKNAWWINEYEDFLIAVKDGKFYYASWDDYDLNYIVEIEHVHRLQNLFFEIERVELTFKDIDQ